MDALEAALHRHQYDNDAPRLLFDIPIDGLLNTSYCKMLSDDLRDAANDGWEIVKATKNAASMIPASPGLYMFVWSPTFEVDIATAPSRTVSFQWILYVGRTGGPGSQNNLKSRYKGEYAKLVSGDPEKLWDEKPPASREERLSRFLSLEPLYFWYCVVDKTESIKALESNLYNLLSPPLNSAGSRRLRPVGKPVPAF